MSGSTFAGKSTTDTIRNYAEMLIDDLNSNFPERGAEHWDKAREIDNKIAKQIFGQEYSDRIGEAYYNCINNYQELELIELKEELEQERPWAHHSSLSVAAPISASHSASTLSSSSVLMPFSLNSTIFALSSVTLSTAA